MLCGYVEGNTVAVNYCPFCGAEVYTMKADGAHVCDECGKVFYVVED